MNRMISISIALAITACGNQKGNEGVDASSGSDGSNGSGSDASSNAKPTIFTIVLENHDYAEIIGSANAPYINSLLAMGALATNYKDVNHPSLPNYLHMISGADQYPGIVDIDPTQFPYFPADKPNLGTQLEAAGIKWRSYQETMGTPCKLAAAGKFAPRPDPSLYLTEKQKGANSRGAKHNVDSPQSPDALAADAYANMWTTPTLDDDGHETEEHTSKLHSHA